MIWRQTVRATRRFLVGLAAASLVGALGCSAGDRPASVSGRVTYNGGYLLPGTAPVPGALTLPDDLEQACIEQVAYWYQRRAQLGLMSVSNDSGIVQQFQSSDLLPQVRAVLKHYERWVN